MNLETLDSFNYIYAWASGFWCWKTLDDYLSRDFNKCLEIWKSDGNIHVSKIHDLYNQGYRIFEVFNA